VWQNFGLTAKQFGDNLMDSVLTHTPSNPEPDPDALATEFMNSPQNREFLDVESVLKASRHVLAREIAFDPHVRTSLRSTFYDHVEISTFPTPKGRKDIDRHHDYFVRARPFPPSCDVLATSLLLIPPHWNARSCRM
jgi:transcription elongation factor SPT6